MSSYTFINCVHDSWQWECAVALLLPYATVLRKELQEKGFRVNAVEGKRAQVYGLLNDVFVLDPCLLQIRFAPEVEESYAKRHLAGFTEKI